MSDQARGTLSMRETRYMLARGQEMDTETSGCLTRRPTTRPTCRSMWDCIWWAVAARSPMNEWSGRMFLPYRGAYGKVNRQRAYGFASDQRIQRLRST